MAGSGEEVGSRVQGEPGMGWHVQGQILGATSAGKEWIGVGNSYCSKKGNKTVPIQEDSKLGFGMSGLLA